MRLITNTGNDRVIDELWLTDDKRIVSDGLPIAGNGNTAGLRAAVHGALDENPGLVTCPTWVRHAAIGYLRTQGERAA